jgi:hypothetical protein
MRNIETSITIKASSQKVWNILTDFEKYAEWNPFIINIEGQPEKGTKLANTMLLEGQKPQIFKPLIIVVDNQKEFRWLGSLFVKGIFDGEHYFLLEQINDQEVKLIQGENFSGILSTPIMKMIEKKTLSGFNKMNMALKARAEN